MHDCVYERATTSTTSLVRRDGSTHHRPPLRRRLRIDPPASRRQHHAVVLASPPRRRRHRHARLGAPVQGPGRVGHRTPRPRATRPRAAQARARAARTSAPRTPAHRPVAPASRRLPRLDPTRRRSRFDTGAPRRGTTRCPRCGCRSRTPRRCRPRQVAGAASVAPELAPPVAHRVELLVDLEARHHQAAQGAEVADLVEAVAPVHRARPRPRRGRGRARSADRPRGARW